MKFYLKREFKYLDRPNLHVIGQSDHCFKNLKGCKFFETTNRWKKNSMKLFSKRKNSIKIRSTYYHGMAALSTGTNRAYRSFPKIKSLIGLCGVYKYKLIVHEEEYWNWAVKFLVQMYTPKMSSTNVRGISSQSIIPIEWHFYRFQSKQINFPKIFPIISTLNQAKHRISL